MRKVSLIPIAMATCGLFAFSAGAQETGKAAKAAASTTPTIDQSLEWKNAFSPKLSPDGKRVVYEVQKANWEDNAFDRNLWIVDVATGESHSLTSAKKSSTNAAWSPDGKWIAFLSDRPGQIKDTPEGKKQLYVISADGGEAQQITKTENDVNAFDWAPDSRRIAFSMSDPEPKTLKDRKEKYGEYSVVHSDYQMAHLWIIDLPDNSANAAPEAKRLTEGDAFSVGSFAWSPDGTRIGRPRKTPHAERISLRQPFCFGRGIRRIVRKIDDPEMRHLVIGVNHGIFAVFFFAVLQRFWFRVRHRKSDAPGIRSPIESIHVIFSLGNLLRFAAVRGNNVELFLAFRRVLNLSRPVGKKRDPFSVRRPRRIGARFFRRSQRVRFAGCNVHNPQVPVERVVLPIGLLHFVNHALPIRRNFWTERVFPFE